jgi:hypothetical protein
MLPDSIDFSRNSGDLKFTQKLAKVGLRWIALQVN